MQKVDKECKISVSQIGKITVSIYNYTYITPISMKIEVEEIESNLWSANFSQKTNAQREKSNIFFSSLTWMPPGIPGVSKDAPLSTKLGFGGLVL